MSDDNTIPIHESDLKKIIQALQGAEKFLLNHNRMNAALHLTEPVFSPLTTLVSQAVQRAETILESTADAEARAAALEQADSTISVP